MRRLLLIPIVTFTLTLPSEAADQLAFDVKETTDATIYSLQLRNDRSVKTIWNKRVPLINGEKPYDWCSLRGWAQNEHGLLALVENNEFFGKLLQFNSNGDLVAELEAGGWLTDIRRGGSIKLEPPNKIEATRPDGTTNRFLIRDGRFADEHGRIFEGPQSLQISLHGSKTAAQTSTSSTVPAAALNIVPPGSIGKVPSENEPTASTLRNDPPASTPWSVIVILIVAVLGLLWLLVKRRK